MRKPETMRFRAATTVAQTSVTGEADCRQLAQEIIAGWKRGGEVDATAAIQQHPSLGRYKSVVLDLAYEEYCLRTERGEAVSTSRFCKRFPAYQRSVLEQIKVAHLLSENGAFLDELVTAIWPQPGDELIGYRIVDELGRGAFARVYLATETALGGRQVAIKLSRHGTAQAEADMLGKLDHANIVPVHSVQKDEATGLTVICMPYLGRATLCDVLDAAACEAAMPCKAAAILQAVREVNGEDVGRNGEAGAHRFLRNGSYVDGVLHLGGQLADALCYAHSAGNNGILHLDLKPSNVLLTSDGMPMLLDFNLSTDEQNGNQPFGGTLPYMSPEQLRRFSSSGRNGVKIDGRSDIYSLGVILYELLAGELPCGRIPDGLATKELADYLMQQQYVPSAGRDVIEQESRAPRRPARQAGRTCGPRPLRSVNPTIDDRVAGVIDRCLAADPQDRPQTAGELAADLRRELSVKRRAHRQARSHPVLAGAIALVLLALIGGTAAFFALRDPYPVRQYTEGIQAFEQHDYDLALEYLNKSIEAQPTPQAYFARARVSAQLGKTDAAIDDLKAARVVGETQSQFIKFADRQLELGRDAFDEEKYDTALHHLKVSLGANASSAEALFLRGRTYAKLEKPDFVAAKNDVEQSLETTPDPKRKAFLGYCYNMSRQHQTAILCYESAINDGFKSRRLLNNLGASHLHLKRPGAALTFLTEAFERSPEPTDQIQPVLHNRARACRLLAELEKRQPTRSLTCLKEALADITAAIAIGNPTGKMFEDRALICAIGTKLGPSSFASPNADLRRAIENGADVKLLRANPTFSPFFDSDPSLSDVAVESVNYESQFFVDPL